MSDNPDQRPPPLPQGRRRPARASHDHETQPPVFTGDFPALTHGPASHAHTGDVPAPNRGPSRRDVSTQPLAQPVPPRAQAVHRAPTAGPTTGQHQGIGGFATGGFTPVERLTGQFNALDLAQSPRRAGAPPEWITHGTITRDTRFRFGIWGASIGAITGILLGICNAFFEGAQLANAQVSIIVITFIFMACFGATCAYMPRQIEAMLRQHNILR